MLWPNSKKNANRPAEDFFGDLFTRQPQTRDGIVNLFSDIETLAEIFGGEEPEGMMEIYLEFVCDATRSSSKRFCNELLVIYQTWLPYSGLIDRYVYHHQGISYPKDVSNFINEFFVFYHEEYENLLSLLYDRTRIPEDLLHRVCIERVKTISYNSFCDQLNMVLGINSDKAEPRRVVEAYERAMNKCEMGEQYLQTAIESIEGFEGEPGEFIRRAKQKIKLQQFEELLHDEPEYKQAANTVEVTDDEVDPDERALVLKAAAKFEEDVCRIFLQHRFTCTLTRGTGDQGADFIGERNGERWAVQVKLYSKPVGNKAVQEVLGSLHIYQCTRAMVVTNCRFTQSAIELAGAAKVVLVGEDDLNELEHIIGQHLT